MPGWFWPALLVEGVLMFVLFNTAFWWIPVPVGLAMVLGCWLEGAK
jgi:hypothetical protein